MMAGEKRHRHNNGLCFLCTALVESGELESHVDMGHKMGTCPHAASHPALVKQLKTESTSAARKRKKIMATKKDQKQAVAAQVGFLNFTPVM